MAARPSILRDRQGVAYIEFALVAPVFLMTLFASVELTRYININQKIEKAAFQIADIVSQSSAIDGAKLATLMAATSHLIAPYEFEARSRIVVTSISRASDTENPMVRWQYCSGDLTGITSEYGRTGDDAALPVGFTIEPKEDLILTEYFYHFSPLMTQSVISDTQLRKFAITRPRLGALDTFTSNCGS